MAFCTVEEAVAELGLGKFVLLMDDDGRRENKVHLVMAARFATPEKVAFALRNTAGILCAPMCGERAEQLGLDMMVPVDKNTNPKGTAFAVPTDAIGTGTGVSAVDRAITFNCLANSEFGKNKFRRPGHVFPLIANPNGLLARQGHTEAVVDLCLLAGIHPPVGLIGELLNADGSVKGREECAEFGQQNGIKMITVGRIMEFRGGQTADNLSVMDPIQPFPSLDLHTVVAVEDCSLPIHLNGKDLGPWTFRCFQTVDGAQLVSCLILGQISNTASASSSTPPLVRIHSKCFTGDTLGSQRCDCGQQLARALEMIEAEGRGILIYMEEHEGRGIGLLNKIRAYKIQETSQVDTFAANRQLGLPEDMRNYGAARAILHSLGCQQIRLLTANAEKVRALEGILAEMIPLEVPTNCHNLAYCLAKRERHKQQQQQQQLKEDDKENIQQMAKEHSMEKEEEEEGIIMVPMANAKNQEEAKSAKSNNGCWNDTSRMCHPSSTSESDQKEEEEENEENLAVLNTGHDKNGNGVHTNYWPTFFAPMAAYSNKLGQIKIGIVHELWNQWLVDKLLLGVRKSLVEAGMETKQIVEIAVPGCWELPCAASVLLPSVNAVICLSVLLRGETAHFDLHSKSIADGLMRLQLDPPNCGTVPIVNGILCCYTEEQAIVRCKEESGLAKNLAYRAIHMATLALDNRANNISSGMQK